MWLVYPRHMADQLRQQPPRDDGFIVTLLCHIVTFSLSHLPRSQYARDGTVTDFRNRLTVAYNRTETG